MNKLGIAVATGALLAMSTAGSTPATVSGANGKIAFSVGSGQVYVARVDGSGITSLGEGASPAWAPDGRKLVLFRRTAGPCAPCGFALDVLDLSRGRRTTIFEGTTFDPAPAWSPSGSQIAFVNQRAGTGDDEIWLVDSDGTNARQLTTTEDNFAPAWSPDGASLAFYGFGSDGVHLFAINSDGTALRQLTGGSGFDLRPSWSPDGARIAFMSDRAGSFELYTITASGGEPTKLTSGGPPSSCQTGCTFPLANPSWSPDGRRIVFSSDRGGRSRLYVVPAAGGTVARLPIELEALDPDWQPAVDLRIVNSRAPKVCPVGGRATLRFRIRNVGPRAANGVHVRVRADAHLIVVVTIGVPDALPPGAASVVKVVIRAKRRGDARLRVAVTAAEADASDGDNRTQARMTIVRRRP